MKFCFFIAFLFLISTLNCQNLVPNGSFEEYKKCPEKHQRIGENWFGPDSWYRVGCTADYYNKCSKNMGVPKNFAGYQEARTGNAYAGFVIWDKSSEDHVEYIEAKLDDSLKKNEIYCVKFYVSLADSSGYETYGISALVSKQHNKNLGFCAGNISIPFRSGIKYDTSEFISNDTGWVEISRIHKAIGGEQYITIGNFMSSKNNKPRKRTGYHPVLNLAGNCAYYYIDDVSVIHITNENECSCFLPAEPVILKNVFFQTGKSALLPKSFYELDKLVKSLKQDRKTTIEISGYTDNTGNEISNLTLSQARAKAVRDYLISKGIDKKRISYKGYGSSKAIAGNESEAGRQKNRRVEFILNKK